MIDFQDLAGLFAGQKFSEVQSKLVFEQLKALPKVVEGPLEERQALAALQLKTVFKYYQDCLEPRSITDCLKGLGQFMKAMIDAKSPAQLSNTFVIHCDRCSSALIHSALSSDVEHEALRGLALRKAWALRRLCACLLPDAEALIQGIKAREKEAREAGEVHRYGVSSLASDSGALSEPRIWFEMRGTPGQVGKDAECGLAFSDAATRFCAETTHCFLDPTMHGLATMTLGENVSAETELLARDYEGIKLSFVDTGHIRLMRLPEQADRPRQIIAARLCPTSHTSIAQAKRPSAPQLHSCYRLACFLGLGHVLCPAAPPLESRDSE
jgi:hypothetical protein